MNDWCAGGCCDWKDQCSTGDRINRATLGWNAAAASFAYGYGRLAEMGFKCVVPTSPLCRDMCHLNG